MRGVVYVTDDVDYILDAYSSNKENNWDESYNSDAALGSTLLFHLNGGLNDDGSTALDDVVGSLNLLGVGSDLVNQTANSLWRFFLSVDRQVQTSVLDLPIKSKEDLIHALSQGDGLWKESLEEEGNLEGFINDTMGYDNSHLN